MASSQRLHIAEPVGKASDKVLGDGKRAAQDSFIFIKFARDAKALAVTKTPEYFVNGRPLPQFGLKELQALVREELARAYP